MRFHSICQVFLVVIYGVLMYATMTTPVHGSTVASLDAAAPAIAFKKVELADKATPLLQAAAAASTTTTTSSSSSSAVSSLKNKVVSELTSGKAQAAAFRRFYHTTKQIYQKILDLQPNCPHMTVNWEKGPSKSLMSVRIKKGNPSERALLFFGEHAREMISVETGLSFIETLCGGQSIQQQTLLKNVGASVDDILNSTEFFIFPNANPYGRRKCERGSYCWRANEKGVDLNRNWGDHWSSTYDHPETFPGTKPFSEEETVLLARAAVTYKPTMFISIHSGTLSMLSPVAHTLNAPGEPGQATNAVNPPGLFVPAPSNDGLNGHGVKPILNVMKNVNQKFCKCTYGAAGKELGYLCPGTCLDYIYNRLGLRYAFAVEIYSGRQGFCRRRAAHSFLETHVNKAQLEAAEEKARLEELTKLDSCFFQKKDPHYAPPSLIEHKQAHSTAPFEVEMPSFAEQSSKTEALPDIAHPDNEYTGTIFPVAKSQKDRSCLYQFNPLNKKAYDATITHWTQALLSFVKETQNTKASYF